MLDVLEEIKLPSCCIIENTFLCLQSLIDERRGEGMYLAEPQNYIDCFIQKIVETRNYPKTVYKGWLGTCYKNSLQ
jgi:hypothetical protein